jgi:hypothetical protein
MGVLVLSPALINGKTPPLIAPKVTPCLNSVRRCAGVVCNSKVLVGADSRNKKSNPLVCLRVVSGSKPTFALEFTLPLSSDTILHLNAISLEISLAARKGSIKDVRHAIGNPGKIRNPM